MKARFNKAIATLTLMIMIMTLMVPVGAFAAPTIENADYTFTESADNDGSFKETINVPMKGGMNPKYVKSQIDTGYELPKGLTLQVTPKPNKKSVDLKLTGKAQNHDESNSVGLRIRFYYSDKDYFTKTFNIMFRKNAPEPEPEPAPGEPGTGDEEDQGQAIILNRGKIRILEIYPHTIAREKEDVNNMDVISRLGKISKYEVTTMSINRLISLKDKINGNYDVVYFNGGDYTRNYVWEHSYGSDITNLCADKLEEFIKSGQLCIFNMDVFSKSGGIYDTILKERFSKYIDNAAYKNVIKVANTKDDKDAVINNLEKYFDDKYDDTDQWTNQRPILQIIQAPATYSAANTNPVSNRLTFSFRVYDPDTPIDGTLKVALYLDRNNDSLYNDNEIAYYQDDGDGVKYTLKVKNGRTGTITYDMPQGLTGIYFWKLVVIDSQNARNEFESVFRLKGNPITVKLLQIKPDNLVSNGGNFNQNESDGKGNLSLIKKFNQTYSDPIDKKLYQYKEKAGEYVIEVYETTVSDFNTMAEGDQITLNGLFDMLVLGFNDNYTNQKTRSNGALGQAAADLIDSFIGTKQSVMFTHDTIHFTYNRELTSNFGAAVGQAFKKNADGKFVGYWSAGLAGSDIDEWESNDSGAAVNQASRNEAVSRINIFDPVRNPSQGNNSRHYQVVNTYPDLAKNVKPVNSSALTLYPFVLEGGEYDDPSKMKVASTHYQWYKLNLEDPEVIPLFNLYAGNGYDKFNDDAMNNYYTYTKGTITFSGTGHKRDNSETYPEYETKLFVNTAIKAYSIANHAPEVTILEPQDNGKVSKADGDLVLRFRAYDFDFDNDYLYYEVFIDAENGGSDADFVSLTDGNKRMMRNGTTIDFIIDKDKLPDVGKFRLKVYAEDEHEANSFEIITLNVVESPMITPSIEICDMDGNPVDGVLVNQKVKAQLTFKASGRTEEEVAVTPAFDLKGAYYTEPEETYLTGKSLEEEVVFSEEGPQPETIGYDYEFEINPESPGETELTMTVTVNKADGLYDEKSSADSVRVRSGQVEFYVVDRDGNPVKNVPIRDVDEDVVLGVTDNSGYLHTDGFVGLKNFKPGALPGYNYDGNIAIYRMDESGNWDDEVSQVNLTYENNRWKVEFILDFSLGVTIDYFKVNMARDGYINYGSAATMHDVRHQIFSPATLVAVVKVEPLASGELRKIDFKIETSDGTNIINNALFKAVILDDPDEDVKGMFTEYLPLKANNERSTGSYADETYILQIEVPRTNGQIVKIPEVTLTTVTPTGGEVVRKLSFSGGVEFVGTRTPMLR